MRQSTRTALSKATNSRSRGCCHRMNLEYTASQVRSTPAAVKRGVNRTPTWC
ncbi:hypothetical protein CGRA01v4_00382 [Colletotrichum graminicola]|nr:hypothetical protein CGRA01v4_00382 [Colletotrichum graminicola]